MTQSYHGSRGSFLKDLFFIKTTVNGGKIVEVRLGEYAIYDGAIDNHDAVMCKLDEHSATSLRDWLIEQYPLEETSNAN